MRKLLADARQHGAGRRYLIQHSAGSGKSNSIAWLAHQLIGLKKDDAAGLRLDHRRHRPAHPRPADPRHDQAVRPGRRDRRPRRALGRPAEVHRRAARRSSSRRCRSSRSSSTRSATSTAAGASRSSSTRRTRARAARTSAALSMALSTAGAEEDDETLEDKINRLMEAQEAAAERQLLRLHRHAEEQDARDLRRAVSQGDGKVKHRPFHSYTMKQAIQEGFILDVLEALHAGRELLQAGQDGRGRPGVRHQAGEEEAAPLRREPRPRDPAQGRDHGRPLPRAGARAEQDRRRGAGDGGDQRHRAGDPVLPRDPRLPRRAQEPVPGDRRLLRRARVRRREGHRGVAQRLPVAARSPTRSRRTRTAS